MFTVYYSDGTTATVRATTPDHARRVGYRSAGARVIVHVERVGVAA